LLTEINDLNKIVEVLRKSWPMVSRKTRVLLAAVVLGAMNQACAVGGGAPDGASNLTLTAAAVAPAVVGAAALPAGESASRPPMRSATQPPAAAVDSVTVSPLADPATRTQPAARDIGTQIPLAPAAPDADLRSTPRISTTILPAGTSRSATPPATPSASPQIATAPPSTSITTLQAQSQGVAKPAQASPISAGDGRIGVAEGDPAGAPAAVSDADAQKKVVYETLWARMRAGFSIPNLESPLVDRHTDWYANRPDYVQRVVERGRRYMHFVVEELEKRGMPLEIALLPMIESAYNPTAYSKAHASGMWQFIPATGRNYGLKQNWWYDGRRDVTAATRAALDYLEKLHGMFGDWRLALAAYNWGEGAVSRAIERNQRQGLPTDYESLRMPEETRNYIPKLQAVKNIITEPERYGLALDDVPNEPYFIRVAAPGQIDFKRAAQLAEVPLEEFRSLNPAHNRPVITADSGSLLIPADKGDIFIANLNALETPLVSWQTYRLERNERLETIAARFGTTAAQLKVVNGVSSGHKLKAGSTLLVPISGARLAHVKPAKVDATDFHPPEVVVEPRTHVTHRGDTLRGIAARYGVTIQQLMTWNHMRTASVRTGQVLRLTANAPVVSRRAEAPRAQSSGTHSQSKGRDTAVARAHDETRPARHAEHERQSRHIRGGQRDARTAGAAKGLRGKASDKESHGRVAARRAPSAGATKKQQIAER
jgi:membrane-bound lytic murein transglycosylase D